MLADADDLKRQHNSHDGKMWHLRVRGSCKLNGGKLNKLAEMFWRFPEIVTSALLGGRAARA